MIFGAERTVLYLESATKALDNIDGSREKAIKQSIENFLSSPDSAFNKSLDSHIHQVRDLNTNTRAFATWCKNEEISKELCVVHVIYRKRNQDDFFARLTQYNSSGKDFKAMFKHLDENEYNGTARLRLN